MSFNRTLEKKLDRALNWLVSEGQNELRKQGHKATGSLINSLRYEITQSGPQGITAVIIANDYGRAVDTGVKSGRVPFSGTRKGSGATASAYIEALLDWAETVKPGLSARERLSFVFAVAHTHKKEGIPTRGSYSFSQNGRRKNWVEYGLASKVAEFNVRLGILEELEREIGTVITQLNRA